MESLAKIEGKLPPKLFFRTYLGLYQHRVDDCPGSLQNLSIKKKFSKDNHLIYP